MNTENNTIYTHTKRDEMTFGYLSPFVPVDLVPDMSGSVQFYTEEEIQAKMLNLDGVFTGLRRSTIDHLENVRQLILYTLVVKFDENEDLKVGVYQRAAGAEAKLKGGYSFGFGGHVETQDIAYHEVKGEQKEGCVSSFDSLVNSGYRELYEEVSFSNPEEISPIHLVGFLSDSKPEQHGFIGNTHLAVIGVVVCSTASDFKSTEENYTTIGWMGKEEIVHIEEKFEPWSFILVDHLEEIEEIALQIRDTMDGIQC